MGPDLSSGEFCCHGSVVKMRQEKEEEKVKCGKDTACCYLVVAGRSTQSKKCGWFLECGEGWEMETWPLLKTSDGKQIQTPLIQLTEP